MNHKNKSLILAIMMALALVISMLGGCSATPAPTATPQPTAAPTQASSAEPTASTDPKLDQSQYYEITLYQETFDPKSEDLASQNSFRKFLKDKFNFGYKQVAYPGDNMEKLALMLSAGDYPDLVRLYDAKYIQAYIKAGALLELGPLAQQYGKDFLKKHEKDIPLWENATGLNDGKLWIYSYEAPDMSYGVSRPYLEWVVRSDILEQQGYPNIANEDDLFNVLKAGIAANPTTGDQKTVGIAYPLAMEGSTGEAVIYYQFNLGRLHHGTLNKAGMIFDPNTKQFIDAYKDASTKEGMLFFNHAYNAGLLDKESITDTYDTYTQKMNSGAALSNWFINWEMDNFNNNLKQAGKTFRYVPVTFELKGQAANGETKDYWVGNDVAWQSMAITKNCKYPERLMEVINYCTSEEGLIRCGWGEEGVQYTIQNGKRVPTQDYYDKMQNDPNYGYTFGGDHQLGFFSGLDSSGQPYNIAEDPDVVAKRMDPIVLKTMQAYGFNTYQDMYSKNKNFKYDGTLQTDFKQIAPVFTDDQNKTADKIDNIAYDYAVKLITAKNDDEFNKLYDEMNSKRDAEGFQQLLDTWNAQYASLCQKYGITN